MLLSETTDKSSILEVRFSWNKLQREGKVVIVVVFIKVLPNMWFLRRKTFALGQLYILSESDSEQQIKELWCLNSYQFNIGIMLLVKTLSILNSDFSPELQFLSDIDPNYGTLSKVIGRLESISSKFLNNWPHRYPLSEVCRCLGGGTHIKYANYFLGWGYTH